MIRASRRARRNSRLTSVILVLGCALVAILLVLWAFPDSESDPPPPPATACPPEYGRSLQIRADTAQEIPYLDSLLACSDVSGSQLMLWNLPESRVVWVADRTADLGKSEPSSMGDVLFNAVWSGPDTPTTAIQPGSAAFFSTTNVPPPQLRRDPQAQASWASAAASVPLTRLDPVEENLTYLQGFAQGHLQDHALDKLRTTRPGLATGLTCVSTGKTVADKFAAHQAQAEPPALERLFEAAGIDQGAKGAIVDCVDAIDQLKAQVGDDAARSAQQQAVSLAKQPWVDDSMKSAGSYGGVLFRILTAVR